MSNTVTIGIVFVVYLLAMIGIGFYYFNRSNKLSEFFLGGRSLNKWVAAFSAQASDMSGWLLIGLPGLAFAIYSGTTEAIWTAIGLAVGTYLNWLIVAKRLRKYTEIAGDSITLSDFFENRFRDKTHLLKFVSGIFTLIFFTIYAASQFSASAKLLNSVFGMDYVTALWVGAAIIVAYTFLGGFMAVCLTDFVQGILMFAALIVVPVVVFISHGGVSVTFDTISSFTTDVFSFLPRDGMGAINWMLLISCLAWGLGYFGQPHILVRFMAIRDEKSVRPARVIAMIWVIITLTCAILVGLTGHAYLPNLADAETVFMSMVQSIFPPIVAGVLLTAILAAIMSTADSQLLVSASTVTIPFGNMEAEGKISSKTLVWISRLAVVVISVIAVLLVTNPESSVFGIVQYAWAGFGAAFGPLVLFSLFWRRTTWQGALAGMVSGGVTAIVWQNLHGGIFDVYELVPGFLIASLLIIVVSLCTKPNEEVMEEFDRVKTAKIGE